MLMNVTSWPVQAMTDKFCRNNGWQATAKYYDPEKRILTVQCLINANTVETRTASYDDICKEFSWKSFGLTPDMQTVLPVPDPDAFYLDPKIKSIKYDKNGNPIIKRARRSKKASGAK